VVSRRSRAGVSYLVEDDRSVLSDHTIKQVETVKVSKFAPGDQDYSSSCFLHALERIID
jgi:hypothetical protein